jgi:hypothetical protein
MTGEASADVRKLKWFVVLTLGPVLISLIAAPLIVRTHWFGMGTRNAWVRQMDYPYEVRGLDAEVVIFGDSTGTNGIDPRLFEQDTGERAVVLPNNIHILGVMQDKPLAMYLSHNKPPRVIVIYLAPWETSLPSSTIWPEGLVMLLRHGTPAEIVRFFVHNPRRMMEADINLVKVAFGRFTQRSVSDAEISSLYAKQGFLGQAESAPPLAAGCRLNPDHALRPGVGALTRQLVQRWQSPETKVVVYLAPIPDCEGAERFAHLSLDPPQLAGPDILPAPKFVDDFFQVHVTAATVSTSTRMLENAMKEIH